MTGHRIPGAPIDRGRRRIACRACGFGALALLGNIPAAFGAGTDAADFTPPRYRPPPDGDEAGMWSVMARNERALADSHFSIRAHGLAAYCHEIVCRLAPRHCADVRTYVVRGAYFDARLAPNGMLQISTALLLRCRNEAELAAIIGHELGHYLRRHAVQRWRETRSTFDISSFWSLGLDVGGVDAVNVLNTELVTGTAAYTPAQEAAADDTSVRLLEDAGYAPAAAAAIWSALVAETVAVPAKRAGDIFFAVHPDPQSRVAALRRLADTLRAGAGELRTARYRTALAPIRALLISDELALRQYERTAVLIDAMQADMPDDAGLWFARGEFHRLRGADGDLARAIAAYERARDGCGAPPETFRSLGLVLLRSGRRDRATEAFNEYLERKPDATDRDAVRALAAS